MHIFIYAHIHTQKLEHSHHGKKTFTFVWGVKKELNLEVWNVGFSWMQINVQSNIQQSARDMVITECIREESDARVCDGV